MVALEFVPDAGAEEDRLKNQNETGRQRSSL